MSVRVYVTRIYKADAESVMHQEEDKLVNLLGLKVMVTVTNMGMEVIIKVIIMKEIFDSGSNT